MAPTPSGTKRADSPSWLKIAGLSSPLTSAEKRVLAALADGSVADVHSGGARQPIRAGLIRAIAVGLALPVEEIDPRGVHVVGALISERIELDDVGFARPLRLIDCELEAGLSAKRAALHLLELEGCTIGAPDSAKAEDSDDVAGDSDDVAALRLDELRVTHGVSFARSEVTGAVRLLDASIGGQLVCDGGTFTDKTGPALHADGLTTTSHVSLDGTFTGHSTDGTVRLLGASIGGQLQCTGGNFTNDTGTALHADGLTTTSDVSLGSTFTGHSTDGAVRLLDASIGGQLQCTGGNFTNDTGPALHADRLTTTSHVSLDGTFTGHSTDGTVRLLGASIGGQLQCTGGSFTNDTGPALVADGLTTTSDVFLGSTFTGHGELGAIRLLGASIGGQLNCAGGLLHSKTSSALLFDGARVHGAWVFDPAFRSTDTPKDWLNLNGFTYAGTPVGRGAAKQFGALDWARLLSGQTQSYAAQPYQHLAGAYRAAGHEQDAKAVLIAQQDDRRERVVKMERRRWRALGIRWRAVAMRLSKLFTGYGYQSWRALWWLLGLAAVSVVLASVAGNVAIDLNTDPASTAQWTTVLAHKPTKSDFGTPCSPVELVGVGIDWAVPIIATKAGEACLLISTHPYGQWWTATSWLFHVLGWAFATLAVAGFTGLIRKL